MNSNTNTITKRLQKNCSCCGKIVNVVIHKNGEYRGGHYFGKIPHYDDKELAKAPTKIDKKTGWHIFYGIRPKKFIEYWECPKCYW